MGGYRSIIPVAALLLLAFWASTGHARAENSWIPSWSPANYGLGQEAVLASEQRADATLRQALRLSVGGRQLRVALTNANGDGPLIIDAVHVALAGSPGSAAIEPPTDHTLHFAGRSGITIPSGRTVTSDPIDMRVPPLARLSVSMHLISAPPQPPGHLDSRSTSWTAHGNQASAPSLVGATSTDHWYFLSAVEVMAPDAQIIVAIGDSITDGTRSAINANQRWPDRLAERLAAMTGKVRWGVVNKGIGGNRLLATGRGPSALDRFDSDVLSVPHARTVILMEGINDLGRFAKTSQDPAAHSAMTARIIAAYEQLILRAHAHRLRIVGATIMPDWNSFYRPTPLDEGDRQMINAWIRSPGHFDAIIDWDAVMRDPNEPRQLNPAYDSDDHIHPSSAGYRVMADAIPIAELIGEVTDR